MKQKGSFWSLLQLLCQETALEIPDVKKRPPTVAGVGMALTQGRRGIRRERNEALEIPLRWNVSLEKPSVLIIGRMAAVVFPTRQNRCRLYDEMLSLQPSRHFCSQTAQQQTLPRPDIPARWGQHALRQVAGWPQSTRGLRVLGGAGEGAMAGEGEMLIHSPPTPNDPCNRTAARNKGTWHLERSPRRLLS